MMESINDALQTFTSAVSALRAAKELLPAGPEREAASKAIDEAERAVKIAEAEAARRMGYTICRCTWPPQIMLEEPSGARGCGACGRMIGTEPVVGDEGGYSWLESR